VFTCWQVASGLLFSKALNGFNRVHHRVGDSVPNGFLPFWISGLFCYFGIRWVLMSYSLYPWLDSETAVLLWQLQNLFSFMSWIFHIQNEHWYRFVGIFETTSLERSKKSPLETHELSNGVFHNQLPITELPSWRIYDLGEWDALKKICVCLSMIFEWFIC
jgi:hypothetical protein